MLISRFGGRAGRHWAILSGLVVLALLLRLARLSFQPLWWDEGWSLYFTAADLSTMLQLTAVDIHPPLYYLLLQAWSWLFGPGVLSVRLLSVLIGVATVPLLYATSRRLLGQTGGLLAVSLLAISPFHIYYSQEVRMYGLVTVLGLAAFYFALDWQPRAATRLGTALPKTSPGRAWLGYVAAAAGALYSQYYAAFLLLALNLLVLVGWRRRGLARRQVLSWLGAQAAVAGLFLPWLVYAGPKLLAYVRFKVSVEQDPALGPLAYVGRHLAAFQWGHAEGALAAAWWLGLLPLLVTALLLLLVTQPWRSGLRQREGNGTGSASPSRDAGLAALLWPLILLVVVLLAGFAVNVAFPFNPPRHERLLLLVLPAYLLVMAGALHFLWQHRRRWAVSVLVAWLVLDAVSLAFLYSVPRYPGDDYRPVAARVEALSRPGDAILCVHPWQVGYFYAYLPDDDIRPVTVLTPRQVLPQEEQLWASDPARMASELDALLATHGRLWLPDHQAMGRVLEAQIEGYLVTRAYPALKEWYGENTVLVFFADGAPAAAETAGTFGEWLALEAAAIDPGAVESGGGVVPIDLTWRVLAQPDGDHRVGLRLVGPAGHIWAQRDAAPLGGLAPFAEWPLDEAGRDRHGLLVPAGTPPGDYQATLRVYRDEDLAVLPVASPTGRGSELVLGHVRVVRPATRRPVAALDIAEPLDMTFGPLRLVGHRTAAHEPLLPGEGVAVDLFWQAMTGPGEDFLPWLRLVGDGGEVVAELAEKPVSGTYPTAWWQAGDLVRDPHDLVVPAPTQPGTYRLVAGLLRAADATPVEADGGEAAVDLGRVSVTGRLRLYEAPVPQHPQAAAMGESVALIGYDLDGSPTQPGDRVHIVIYWHTLSTPEQNYHTFVHLIDGAPGDYRQGQIVAQADGVPGQGRLPTRGWLPGEYVPDPHVIQLPPDLSPGDYYLAIGLYDPVDDNRLGEPVILSTPVQVQGE